MALALAPVPVLDGTVAAGEAELVARGCFFLADGEADGDWEGVAMGARGELLRAGRGPALKPRLEAEPLPGDTSRNAATMTPAMATGPTPNSRTFISVLRPLQARVQPGARLAWRAGTGREPRAAAGQPAGRTGPRPGCPLGYQPTLGPSSGSGAGSGGGTDAAGACPGAERAGPGSDEAGSGADGGGGGGEEAPKLGGIPPGLACSP